MTATQAPTPGPLTSESVKLLVKGDILLCADRIIRSVEQVDVERGVLWFTDGEACGPSVCVFIGRTDESGWMPWSGGEPTITDPTVDIEVRLRNGELHVDRSPAFDWTYDPEPHPFDIIAFRLAPTAPVEASGSEREADAWKWLGQLYPNDAPSDLAYDANEMVDAFLAGSGRSDRMAKALERIADEQQYRSGYCQTDITVEPALTAEEAQTVAREALAQQTAPRPQPSGETRELAAYFGTYRPHVADGAAVTVYVPLTLKQIDATIASLSTTPARAEAQDEGAAGDDLHQALTLALALLGQMEPTDARAISDEFVAMAAAQAGIQNQEGRDIIAARLKQPFPSIPAEVTFEDAHPSPTPAADEDRVRLRDDIISIVEDARNNVVSEPWETVTPDPWDVVSYAADRILALKSTAAKEGEKS